jgi:hypothetical protein
MAAKSNIWIWIPLFTDTSIIIAAIEHLNSTEAENLCTIQATVYTTLERINL